MASPHPHTRPGIRAYLEARAAGAGSWSPDERSLLISSNVPGTAQAHRLDLDGSDLPVPAGALAAVTALDEPAGAAYLPADATGAGRDSLLIATDSGGNERHQLYAADAAGALPYTAASDLDAVAVDPDHIHSSGGVTRDGRWLAYATNRRDGVAFDVWVHDLADGSERCVWLSGGWGSAGGFSPDGRWLSISEPTLRAGDNRTWLVDLEALGEEPADPDHPAVTEIAPHDDAAAVGGPSWLPDSSAFFFSTDVDREHAGIARGTPDGAWSYVVEPGWEAGCTVDWAGRHLLVAWNADGRTRAELRDPVTLAVTRELELPGAGVASGFRLTRDGARVSFTYSSPMVPGDAWMADTATGALTRLTTSPCDVDTATFVDGEAIRYTSFDGLEVPAFVFRPREGAGPFPVVVVIHGGPESQYRPSFAPLTQYLVAEGFAVVAPNVRGSTGYGRSYQHLDDVEKRLDSVADLAGLHAWIAATDDLDADRAALYGGSYGGYMTLAGLAFQPDLWAAGVDIVGMSDLVTFLENTSEYRRAYREREYGSLAQHRDVLEAASPINRVTDMRAPLFIVHGANDPRVPLSEAEQIHRVLTERGVRTELAVYDDEGHGLAKLDNRIDAYTRIAAFLHEVLDA